MNSINFICEVVIAFCGLILLSSFLFSHEIKKRMDAKSGKYWKTFWNVIGVTAVVCIVAIIVKSLL